jgi:hypothetical protein
MTCSCGNPAPYEIRGTALCLEHYIEALEHSAHLVSLVTGADYSIRYVEPSSVSLKNYLDKGPIY